MTNRRALMWALVAAAALGTAGAALAGQEDVFTWSGPVTGTLEIKGVNGDILARASAGEASVEAVKRGRRDDPSEVRIEVVEHAGGVTICAVYPGTRNSCEPGSGGSLGAEDHDVTVDFHVSVPAAVDFTGRTVNGSVSAEEIDGNVRASTVNGTIRAEAAGWVLGATVNGDIRATMGRADWPEDPRFTTVNGSVDLALPADLSAEVRLKLLNGEIETDFPIDIHEGRFVGTKARGTIGGGEHDLEIETVNGSIRLRRN